MIDRESVLAGKLLWKLFQTYFTGMAKSVALDLTNQVFIFLFCSVLHITLMLHHATPPKS
jgi:hypothetical protein